MHGQLGDRNGRCRTPGPGRERRHWGWGEGELSTQEPGKVLGGLQEESGAEGSIPTKGYTRVWAVRPSPGQVFENQSEAQPPEPQEEVTALDPEIWVQILLWHFQCNLQLLT